MAESSDPVSQFSYLTERNAPWFRVVIGVLGLVALTVPAAAETRTVPATIVLTDAMIPYVYQYASCVFGGEGLAAAERIAECKETRNRLEFESAAPFAVWHRGAIPTRARQFKRALDQLETESQILEVHYGPMPQTITAYLFCVGSSVAATDAFTAGRSIDYPAFDGSCREKAGFSFETAPDLDRRLYQRVRKNVRVIRAPLEQMETLELSKGLLAGSYR